MRDDKDRADDHLFGTAHAETRAMAQPLEMRILHCVESLDPAAGGPARSVPQLALAQLQLGHEVALWSLEAGAVADLDSAGGSLRHFRGPIPEVFRALAPLDVVHDHGIWLPFHREIARGCARLKVPRVVSPRGMLEPWAINHKKWKKRMAWWLYQRSDLLRASALHATAESEAEHLRELGFRQPIIVAANGVAEVKAETLKSESHTGALDSSSIQNSKFKIQNQQRTALFLSRIHPQKGLSMLLDAWARLRPDGWRLRIVGPDEGGHVKELKGLCDKLGLTWIDEMAGTTESCADGEVTAACVKASPPCIWFCGPLEGLDKWAAFREADLFVLPTYSENFGIAVAEALASGVPVITTTGAPWQGLVQRQCGWWVEPKVEPITRALAEAVKLSDKERQAMGGRGVVWVREEFGWEEIARKMEAFYELIIGRA